MTGANTIQPRAPLSNRSGKSYKQKSPMNGLASALCIDAIRKYGQRTIGLSNAFAESEIIDYDDAVGKQTVELSTG